MREVLFDLKEEGKTILLSSHILEDVERLTDRAGFLVDGRIRREMEGRERRWIEVFTEGFDTEAVRRGHLEAERIVREGEKVRIALRTRDDLPRVQGAVQAGGGRIVRIEERRESLEEAFVENVESREHEEEPV